MARRRIDVDNLPSNSEQPERYRESLAPIVQPKRRSRGSSLAGHVQSIGNGLWAEIVIPTFKSLIVDFFSSGVNQMMFPDTQDYRGGIGRQVRRKSYNRIYDDRRSEPRRRQVSRRHVQEAADEIFEDVFFNTRGIQGRIQGSSGGTRRRLGH